MVHNGSVEPVSLTALVDAVDGAPSFDVAASASTTCSLPQPILPGAAFTCAFTVPVTGNAGDIVADVVTATATDDDGNSTTAHDDASVAVTDALPTISVTKTAGVASVTEPGGPVTYSVVVHNASVEPVSLSGLSDVVDGHPPVDVSTIAGSTCDLPVSIPAGGDHACSFTLAVAANAGDTVGDEITASASDDDGNVATATDTASVLVTDALPAITVTKSASPSSVAEPGDDVSYTVAVANLSVEPLTLTALADVVGSGASADVTDIAGTTCDLPRTLPVGGGYSCTFTLAVTGDAGDIVTDVVTATATDDDGNSTTAQAVASVSITDVLPGITVSKTAGVPSVDEPGGPVTYTATVHNESVEALTITTLSDVVAGHPGVDVTGIADTTCALPHTLAVGGSYTCTFTLLVAGAAGDIVTDVVTATAVDDDGNSTTGQGGAGVSITDVLPTITVTKTAGAASVAEPGGVVTYSLVVHNGGVEPVTVTDLSDVVGDGSAVDITAVPGTTCTLPATIAIGGDLTCAFPMTVSGNAGATVVDTATATAVDDDGNTATGSDNATVTITDVLPTMTVVKQAVTTTLAAPGGPAIYSAKVTNTSAEPITVHSITDTVQGRLLDLTALAAPLTATTCAAPVTLAPAGAVGDSLTCSFTVVLVSSQAGDIVDVVTAHGTDDDGNPIVVSDDATTAITPVVVSPIVPDVTVPTVAPTRPPLPLAAVEPPTIVEAARGPLPKTGADLRGWMTAADAILIIGVLLLLAETTQLRRRRGGRHDEQVS